MTAPTAPCSASSRRILAPAAALVVAAFAAGPAVAEQQVHQFWPEANLFVKLDEHNRLFLLGSVTRARDTATSTEGTIGVHWDWFALQLPLARRSNAAETERRWSVWFRTGYNRIEAYGGGAPDENRLLADATLRSEPLAWGLQVANRSRFEWRDVGDETSWRYRNRSRIERGFTVADSPVGLATVVPYAMLEWTWDSRVSRWNRRFVQFGVELERTDGWGLELYVGVQEESRAQRSTVVALGAVVSARY